MLDINKDIELSKYRYSSAEETLRNARMCLENGFYRDAINRSYYAMFYAIKAILALGSIDFKRHKDVVAYFNKEYVAGGVFLWELGRRIARLKTKREESDYDDFFVASKEEAVAQIETVEFALPLIKKYLTDNKVL